jgi:hypothetical protein
MFSGLPSKADLRSAREACRGLNAWPWVCYSTAMKIGMAFIACTMMLLTGCGFADQYSSMPKFLRQSSAEPPQPDPEPDVKELIRVGADKLFTAHPSAVAVSRPRRITGQAFSVCVKAVVPGAIDGEPRSVTVLVAIEHGKLAGRQRATANDGCATETYEKVNL